MQKNKLVLVNRVWLVIVSVGILIAVYAGLQKPWSTPTITHTPDEKHVHQVFGKATLTQQFVSPTSTVDGVRLYISDTTVPKDSQALLLTVHEPQSSENIRTIDTTFGLARDTEYTDQIFIPFERISGVRNQLLEFTLSVPDATKTQALRVRYQSDAQKYPPGRSFTNAEDKQGNLGFVLYERPTIATRVLRWFFDEDHQLALLGLLVMLTATFLYSKTKQDDTGASRILESLQSLSLGRLLVIGAAILSFLFIVYAPALRLFYFFDDVPILARAQHFSQTNPWNLFTMRPYVGEDPDSQFSLPHWRPLSADFYPLFIVKVFGLNAAAAYATNLILIAVTGVCITALAYVLLRNWWATALTTLIWLVHSSRIGVVYWWISSQDIIASLFFMLGLLIFLYWRAKRSRWILYTSAGLYFLGLLSKEHVLLLPIVVIALDWFLLPKFSLSQRFKQLRPILCLYAIVAGLYLILRTVAFWDPIVSEGVLNDPTYTLTTNPISISKNVLAFSAWTAEHQFWPQILTIDKYLQPWKDPVRITKPIYPGIVLILLYLALIAWKWKSSKTRSILMFAGLWWIVMLGPLLLITRIWFSRWLYMPVFGLALLIAYGWQHLPRQSRKPTVIAAILALSIYGFWSARLPEPSKVHREQSAYTQEAVQQAIEQKDKLADSSRIYAVGVTENQRTSITNYLFYLAYNREVPLVRVNEIPQDIGPHDIVIDMSDYDAYYPEND